MKQKKRTTTKKSKKGVGRRVFLFVLIVEVLFLSFWAVRIIRQLEDSQQEVREAEAKLRVPKEKNTSLREIEKKLTEKFYRERLAREKLSLAREGEIIYKIVPSSPERKPSPTPP